MRYLVLAFLCLIAIISYVQRTGINSLKKEICEHLSIDTQEFGALGSAWLIGYAIMQVPAGCLADRFGGRNVLAALAIVWSVLTCMLGLCEDFRAMLALWFVMGLAQAGVFPCAAKSIGAWLPDSEKAMASGLLGSSTMLGLAAAAFFTSLLVFRAGVEWQHAFVLYGIIGIVWGIAYFALTPERHAVRGGPTPMTQADWARMASSVHLWLLCGQQFFRAGAMIFFINWFPAFLKEARQIEEYQAGVYAGAIGIAAMTGGILGGFFSDGLFRATGNRRLSRQGMAFFGMTCAGVFVIVTFFIESNPIAVTVFAVGAFIASFGGVSGYTVAIEFGGTRIGVVFSMMNMAGNLSAAIVTYVAGALTQHTGSWNATLFLVAAIFGVDAVCWALLNPRRPLFEDSPLSPVGDDMNETAIRAGDPPLRRTENPDHDTR